MKLIKITILCIVISTLTNCASGYKMIKPTSINYISTYETDGVKLEYKYDLLDKKYVSGQCHGYNNYGRILPIFQRI